MKNNLKFAAIGVGFLVLALFGLYWGQSYMDSLYAFRSPLKDTPPAPGTPPIEAKTRKVVVVLIDGLRFDTSQKTDVMPFLNELRQDGAWAEMHSQAPTYSTPSYVVLMTGAWQEVSDGPAMNLEYDAIPAMTQDQIFAIARRQGFKTAVSAYYWFEKLIPTADQTEGFYTAGEDHAADLAVMAAAQPWLADPQFGLILIHLDQVDYAGHHEGGALSPNWDAAALRTDGMIREVAASLDFSQDTLLVISDHGHIDNGGHGGQDAVTRVEPFVLVGAGVRPGAYPAVNMVDVAPTIAVLLGGNLPAASQGHILTEMLQLSEQEIAAVREAEQAQQSVLLAAYTAAIEQPAQVSGAGDPVEIHQSALEAAQQTRQNRERLPRSILAASVLALPLLWAIRSRPRNLPVMFAGVAAYILVFYSRYSLLDGKTFSLSSVPGAADFLIYTAITTFLAYAVGAGVVYLLSRRIPINRPGTVVLGFTALLLYLLALPAGYSFGMNGNTFTWILPEYGSSFLSFISVVQILFAGILGAVAAFGMALYTSFRRTDPKQIDYQTSPQAR